MNTNTYYINSFNVAKKLKTIFTLVEEMRQIVSAIKNDSFPESTQFYVKGSRKTVRAIWKHATKKVLFVWNI